MVARTYTLDEILSLIARRRWLILVPFALGVAAAPLLARYAPERYRSDALILVIPQRVPDSYVKPTVSQSVEERLPSITDQILSRSRLERIIQELDLYKAERSREVMENVVQMMRDDVITSAVGKAVNSFRVSYVSHNAETARKVTERLASLYIEQNLRDRENQADSTSQFLATQLEEAKRRLIEQEKKLEDYRKGHAGQLPTQLQGNLQAIQNANLQLQSLNESTNRAQERRLLIERQIADTQAVPLPPAPLPLATPEAPAPASTAQQLDLARARLASFLQRYTPDHPEVVSLERTIADLVVRLESETPTSVTQAVPEKPITAAEAAVSTVQVRNRGTLCGNVAHGFPTADPPPALIACGAGIVLRSRDRGEREVYPRCVELLDQCGLAAKANRLAGSLTLLDRKRLELARALATQPRVLLLDEVAGGMTEHECTALVDLIRRIRQGGISIIWIEHVVHALMALVDRLLVLHGGSFIGEGAPQNVIVSPAVREIYMGIPADA